jgi:rhamnosyl/mannosyltransferase
MRILHVYRTYFPDAQGGLQEAIKQISLATQPYQIESKIFVLSPNPNPKNIFCNEGEIIRSKSWLAPSSCDLGGISAFKEFREQARWADVIHYHFPWPFSDLLNLLSGLNKPALTTYHSDIVKQKNLNLLYAPLRNVTLNSMKAIVATSPPYIESSPVLNCLSSDPRLKVIPLGLVEKDQTYVSRTKENSFLSKNHLYSSEYLLFLGVLRYYKGVHFLIKAAKNIKGKIVIAGNGPEMSNLQELVKSLNLSNILFLGEVTEEEKHILIKNTRALVLPSHLRSEAFGMVLIEACLHSKAMISCDITTGTSYVNLHNLTGIVVPPVDPTALAKACNQLLSDYDLAFSFGMEARLRYDSLFSGQALGQAYAKLYKEIA